MKMNFLKLIEYLSKKHNYFDNNKLIELLQINDDIEKNQKIIINNKELEKVCQLNKLDIIKFYYFNKSSIHNLLYKFEKNIKLNYDEKDPLSYYFYLSLLIRDNLNIVNYSYSIEYIRKINEKQKNNNGIYNKIMISKIILELIDNYKGLYEYIYNINEIKVIEKENIKIINENINVFNSLNNTFNYNDIKNKKIDEIYSEIIFGLIKNNKLDNFDIIEQLNFESINLTNLMINSIIYFFNDNKNLDLINKYKISEKDIEDISINKINFYFILLEYILKDSYLIYKIKFLLETKIIFKKNYHKIKRKSLEKDFNRLNTIIQKLLDSKYYDTNILEKKSENNINGSKDNIQKTKKSNDSNNDLTSKSNNISSSYFSRNSNKDKDNKEVQPPSSSVQETEKNEENGILKFERKIECHSKNEKAKTVDFITEVNTKESNYFMSGGSNNIINIYKIDTYNYFSNIKLKEWPYNISVINNNKIACSKKEIILIEKNKKKNEFVMNQKIYKEKSNLNYILGTINNKEAPVYYCCTDKGVMIISNLLAKIIEKTEYTLFKDLLIKSSFQIDNKIIVFKSNKIVTKGKNKLYFFNYISKKEITADIEEIYSFVYFANGFSVMPIKNKNPDVYNNNILLCACKKYSKKQRNGILVVNIMSIKKNDKEKENKKIYLSINFIIQRILRSIVFAHYYNLRKKKRF